MSQYPKNIGEVLWLHFTLLLDVHPKTGVVETSVTELSNNSYLPRKLILPTLQKLVKYGFITLKSLTNESLLITLKHYGM